MGMIKKAGEKIDEMNKWTKRIFSLGLIGTLITVALNFGVQAQEHFTLGNRVAALETNKRIDWLEKQEVACEEEKKAEGQSERRKINEELGKIWLK